MESEIQNFGRQTGPNRNFPKFSKKFSKIFEIWSLLDEAVQNWVKIVPILDQLLVISNRIVQKVWMLKNFQILGNFQNYTRSFDHAVDFPPDQPHSKSTRLNLSISKPPISKLAENHG